MDKRHLAFTHKEIELITTALEVTSDVYFEKNRQYQELIKALPGDHPKKLDTLVTLAHCSLKLLEEIENSEHDV
jgi:hypothetical protein